MNQLQAVALNEGFRYLYRGGEYGSGVPGSIGPVFLQAFRELGDDRRILDVWETAPRRCRVATAL